VTRAYVLVRDIFGLDPLARDRRPRQQGPRAAAVRDADRGRAPGGARHPVVPGAGAASACRSTGAGDLPAGAQGAAVPGAQDPVGGRPHRVGRRGREPAEAGRAGRDRGASLEPWRALRRARRDRSRSGAEEERGIRGGALLRPRGRAGAALVRREDHATAHRHAVAGARSQCAARRPREPAARAHRRGGQARAERRPGQHARGVEGALRAPRSRA
jgi:hypothetical protein